jgi:hypothetical protein
MPAITVEITAGDVAGVGWLRTGARVAQRALLRIGLIGEVRPDLIWLYNWRQDEWHKVETPGQLRRFMRLFDDDSKVPPPRFTIEVPEGSQEPDLKRWRSPRKHRHAAQA